MPLDDGVWDYSENDPISPTFSEYMNRGTESARTRIQAAEAAATAALEAYKAAVETRLPYAMAAGTMTLATNNTAQGPEVSVTFPAGRFTVPPLVRVSSNNAIQWGYSARITARSATGFTARLVSKNVAPYGTESGEWIWEAVQMAPTAAAG